MDLAAGDPPWLPHPVRFIGKLIEVSEKYLRAVFPKTPRGELWAGALLVVIVAGISAGLVTLLLWLCGLLSPAVRFLLETILCWQFLAVKSLKVESMKVFKALMEGDLEKARQAVSMIVGRDTERLDEAEVARAAVETVAESASDGILAPLLYMAIGGAPLGILYKAVNTMDSMVGYKNDRYLYFGRAAARTDDVLNFIPARFAGILMCISAYIAGFNGKNAFKIFFRDRKNHKSPNSAHTEAACAGALGLKLGGTNLYFGVPVEKPTIGDALRRIEAEDITRVNKLTYCTAFLGLALFCLLPLLWTL
jgi:adenosylcobinamide-phosphate synthase